MRHDTPPLSGRSLVCAVAARMAAVLAVAVAVSLATPCLASWSGDSVTIDVDDHAILDSCAQVKIRYGRTGGSPETVRSSETLAVPRAGSAPLRVSLTGSSGIRIQPWDKDTAEVDVCRAAGARTHGAAMRILEGVDVDVRDGAIVPHGPEEGQWVVFLILRVPQGASIDVTAENGQIGARGVTGTLTARSKNGPIALEDCAGEVRARTENGPLASSGGRGKQQLDTQNGPLAITLTGRSWEGAGITGETVNGPLALSLAPDYDTGVRVDMAGPSPVVCSGAACRTARRTRGSDRRSLSFGREDAAIRLKTVNGPVAIESSGEGSSDDDEEKDLTWG